MASVYGDIYLKTNVLMVFDLTEFPDTCWYQLQETQNADFIRYEHSDVVNSKTRQPDDIHPPQDDCFDWIVESNEYEL